MVAHASPLEGDEDRVDAAYDGKPMRYRNMDNMLGELRVPGLVQHDVEAELHLEHDSEPCSFAKGTQPGAP